jgi:hypothetical protein
MFLPPVLVCYPLTYRSVLYLHSNDIKTFEPTHLECDFILLLMLNIAMILKLIIEHHDAHYFKHNKAFMSLIASR